MKAFYFFLFFLFVTGTLGRENKTRSFFVFINNLIARRLSRTLMASDHSAWGFIMDWIAAMKYRRGEIAFNATVGPSAGVRPASLANNYQSSFLRILHSVSIKSFSKLEC